MLVSGIRKEEAAELYQLLALVTHYPDTKTGGRLWFKERFHGKDSGSAL